MIQGFELSPPSSATSDRRLRYLLRDQLVPVLDEVEGSAGTSNAPMQRYFVDDIGSTSAASVDIRPATIYPGMAIADVGFRGGSFFDFLAANPPFGKIFITFSESASTSAEDQRTGDVRETLARLVDSIQDDIIRDGIETNLSLGMVVLIRRYPKNTLAALAKYVGAQKMTDVLLGHILRAIGRVSDQRSQAARLNFIAGYLRHESAYIRDAATIALAYMDDQSSIPFIRAAIEAERNKTLRSDMIEALATINE